jgi:microcystin-dependent protein
MKKILPLILAALSATATVPQAQAGDQPFIGEVQWFAGNFAPRGWALCEGQLLPIVQNTALFSLLGTNYGGDGRTTFALPDMRGRGMVHVGQGPGLSPRSVGEEFGSETQTLTLAQMPRHDHNLRASASGGDDVKPDDRTISNSGRLPLFQSNTVSELVAMDSGAIGSAGGGQSHENMQPSIALKCIIATEGVYPSRN